jgi:hypothetical protein
VAALRAVWCSLCCRCAWLRSWLNHTNTTELPLCRFVDTRKLGGASAAAAAGLGGPGAYCIDGDESGVRYIRLIIGPQAWTHTTSTLLHFHVRLTRTQLPLLHAWAITVHKSQVGAGACPSVPLSRRRLPAACTCGCEWGTLVCVARRPASL